MRLPILAAVGLLAASPVLAAAAPAKNWKDSAQASFVNANGNSKATTTSAKDAFSYAFDALTDLDLEAGALGSRSLGQVTAEQYYAQEKLQRKWDARDYVFEHYRWDKNRFEKLISRHAFSVGAGRELWKTPKNEWTGEFGPGYVVEDRIGELQRTYASARVYTKFVHDFSATARFSQSADFEQSLKDDRDNLLRTETALTTTLTAVFSLKTSFDWKHVGQPAPGAVKDDTLTSVALIANF